MLGNSSMAAIIDDKEARLEDVFPFLGVRQKNLPDICYPLKAAPSQLMLPPIPHMHRHWTSFDDELELENKYFLVLFSRRLHDLIRGNTSESDMNSLDLNQSFEIGWLS